MKYVHYNARRYPSPVGEFVVLGVLTMCEENF